MIQGLFLTIIMIFDIQIRKAKRDSKKTLKEKYFLFSANKYFNLLNQQQYTKLKLLQIGVDFVT